jgi:translocator protein
MEKKILIKNILISFLPVLIVAVLGSVFTSLGMEWFNALNKPSEWLPNYIIPIVWSVIYLLASIILFIWNCNGGIPKGVNWLFAVNGLLNIFWCLSFFTLNQLFFGLVLILFNVVCASFLIIQIDKYRPQYSRFLLIYPIWLYIATTLNIAVWVLN